MAPKCLRAPAGGVVSTAHLFCSRRLELVDNPARRIRVILEPAGKRITAAGATWTNCSKAIATNVNSFTVTPQDLTTKVCCTITFAPRFTSSNPGVTGTTLYANTFLRNAAARQ